MNIKGALTICRCSNGKINLYVEDDLSGVRFLELEIEPAEFANALTGLGAQECDGQVRGLECLGKQRESEKRQVEYTGPDTYKQHEIEAWLVQNCQEEGWLLLPYLGSQGSVVRKDGKTFLNYTVKRYVEAEA